MSGDCERNVWLLNDGIDVWKCVMTCVCVCEWQLSNGSDV